MRLYSSEGTEDPTLWLLVRDETSRHQGSSHMKIIETNMLHSGMIFHFLVRAKIDTFAKNVLCQQ